MKSKTTLSRDAKFTRLLKIQNDIVEIIITAKKIDLTLINAKELKEVTRKVDSWLNDIKLVRKGITNKGILAE
jgi:hypothetical protein